MQLKQHDSEYPCMSASALIVALSLQFIARLFDYMPTYLWAFLFSCSRMVPFPLSLWPPTTALKREGWVGGVHFFKGIALSTMRVVL